MKSNACYADGSVIKVYEKMDLFRCERQIFGRYLFQAADNGPGMKQVLDVGCHVGRVSFYLAEKGMDVVGIDVAHSAIQRANELKKEKDVKNVRFLVADGAKIPFKDDTFDFVLLPYNTLDGIPSLKKRQKVVHECTRVLKDGGLMLFSTHNRYYFKFFVGMLVLDSIKVICRALSAIGLRTRSVKEWASVELGSYLWLEPGAKVKLPWYFGSPGYIRRLCSRDLVLVRRFHIENQSPENARCSVMDFRRSPFLRPFRMLLTPQFYYVFRKSRKPGKS